jgi:alpha-glucoside transport system substrate-binding protein
MKPRTSSFLLVSVLVLLLAVLLVGCADDDGDETTTTAAGGTGTTEGTDTTEGGEAEDISGETVNVLGLWGGTELEGFQSVYSGWEEDTGATLQFEGTRDLTATLRTRIGGNNPPDIAVLPNPALMTEFAQQGVLLPLDEVLDADQLAEDYSEAWLDMGMVDDQLYGLLVKAAAKSTVWYNPPQFEEAGFEVPATFDDMVSLSDQIAEAGEVAPWSMGLNDGAASGWPGTDWIQEILLHESGPDVYDQWVNHEIPWTDDAVRSAWEKFGQFLHGEGYLPGGAQFAVSTSPSDASFLPFEDPPRAYMYFLGGFTEGFIASQFPDLEASTDYNFFQFPTINSEYEGAVTGSGDIVVMFNDTPAARSFMNYMADGANWAPWAEQGGFTTPSSALDASAYPSDLIAGTAEQLTEASVFRFDADDMMPAELQNAYFQAVVQYAQNPDGLDGILQSLEDTAEGAYQQ